MMKRGYDDDDEEEEYCREKENQCGRKDNMFKRDRERQEPKYL